MRYLRFLPVAVAILLTFALVTAKGQAQVINGSSGTSGATPYPVGTSTPVVILGQVKRCSWVWNWLEAGDLCCAPILAGSSPVFTPSVSGGICTGYRFTSTKTPWISNSLNGDPSIGFSCVSTVGTLNIYTYEDLHCFNTKVGMP